MNRFFIALSSWLDGQPHGENCGFGHVVQSGLLEGNKLPCTCGLAELQAATSELSDNHRGLAYCHKCKTYGRTMAGGCENCGDPSL